MSEQKNLGDANAATATNNIKPSDSHTPIIITDGSASIEFTTNAYTRDPDSNNNTANAALHLVNMVCSSPHTPNGNDFPCFEFQSGQQYEIEVKCAGGGGFNDFKIRGSRDPNPPPQIEVDQGEYKEDAQFPPVHTTTGHRFVSRNRGVTKVRIFRIVNGQRITPPEHDCPLAQTPRNSWTIDDAHVTNDDDHDHDHVEEVVVEEVVQPA